MFMFYHGIIKVVLRDVSAQFSWNMQSLSAPSLKMITAQPWDLAGLTT